MGFINRLKLGWGKLRRAYIHALNRSYLRRNHARRRGECARCGACCKLMFRCPYLKESDGGTECVRHGTRWENCRVFPIDERDIADRDLVSKNGPCGYSFEPSKRSARWFPVILAVVTGLAGANGHALAAEAGKAKREAPLALRASFASGRAPEGWRIASGTWEPARKGLRCASDAAAVAATLRDDMTPVSGMDFRVEIWATFEADGRFPISSMGPGFHIGVRWGKLEAGVSALGPHRRAEVAFQGKRHSSGLDSGHTGGKFRAEVALGNGLVSVRVGKERPFVVRDVFGSLASNAPRDVVVSAGPGTVIHAVRVSATPVRARARTLARGDEAWRGGDRRRAAVSYMEALSDDSLARPERAEAALKLGLHFTETEAFIDAARSFDRAQRLDHGGPWGERARVALGRSALAVGDAETALRFARAAAEAAGPALEDWGEFSGLVSSARKGLVGRGEGSRATYALRLIAERLEWDRFARQRTRWAWEEVAKSLDGRGWEAEATAVRRRAMSVLGRRVEVPATAMELTSDTPAPSDAAPADTPPAEMESPTRGEGE